jgi:hypothetical protein
VEEHQLERQLRRVPPRLVGLEADVAILIVRELGQLLRQVGVGLPERRCGKLLCAQGDIVERERGARRRKQERDKREAGGTQCRDVTPQKQKRPPKWRPKPPAQTVGPQ